MFRQGHHIYVSPLIRMYAQGKALKGRFTFGPNAKALRERPLSRQLSHSFIPAQLEYSWKRRKRWVFKINESKYNFVHKHFIHSNKASLIRTVCVEVLWREQPVERLTNAQEKNLGIFKNNGQCLIAQPKLPQAFKRHSLQKTNMFKARYIQMNVCLFPLI